MLIRTTVTLNRGNQGVAMNTFCHTTGAGSPTWAVTSAVLLVYLNNIYSPLRSVMNVGMTLISCTVESINPNGTVIGALGSIAPTVNGLSNTDMNSGPTSMTIGAKTVVPRVRGNKRFAGANQDVIVGQLFQNPTVVLLAQAAAAFITPYVSGGVTFTPGVISVKEGGFVPFSLSGAVAKNIPGTQVTRKPGRGI